LAPVLQGDARLYLETSSPENVVFYKRLGFTVSSHVTIAGGPDLWTMSRAT
jgi:hypothetical protein